MRALDYLHGVRRAFVIQRVRSALTLLGIVIGTGSIVMLAGLLRGAEEALMRLNQGVHESDTVRIRREEPPADQLQRTQRPLSRADVDALDASPALAGTNVAAEVTREAKAHWMGRRKRVRLLGAAPPARAMYRLNVALGRFIDDADLAGGRRVAVLGHEVFTELLGEDPAVLGRQLTIDDETWTIVGVLAHKPTMGHGDGTWMWDRRVVVPQRAFDAVFDPAHGVSSIFMRSPGASSARIDALGKIAEKLLLRRHLGVKNFEVQDRSGRNQERLIISIIQILLLATGLMSLFVGGINIMNIMLVTVTERTREIGVRRAIGASPGAILIQFVLEAAAVSTFGGALGVLGGIALTWLLALALGAAFGGWAFHLVPWSIAAGLGLALITGVAFGLFPAWRASRLSPVDALRYE